MKKRLLALSLALFCFAVSVTTRLGLCALWSGADLAAAAADSRTATVIYYTSRAVITDRNGKFLTDAETSTLALVDTAVYNGGAVFDEKYEAYFEGAAAAKSAALLPVRDVSPDAVGVTAVKTLTRYSENQPAVHLIGSLGGAGDGASGLEYAFNGFLRKNEKKYYLSYEKDPTGRLMSGIPAFNSGDAAPSNDRLVLTIDLDLQRIVEKATESLGKGAVVVAAVKTGEVVAMVSRPLYHPYDMAAAVATEGSLINKCLMAYNAGSAFKLVTLAAFLESGGREFYYDCAGAVEAGDRKISCYNKKAHGELDIAGALAVSCNGFFIKMGLYNGAEKMLATAKRLGFGAETPLAEGYGGAAGNLPTESDLISETELANFSMGQGKLLVTPLQMLGLTQIIANGGVKAPLHVVKGRLEDGVFHTDAVAAAKKSRLLSKETADFIADCMRGVTASGTGKKASPSCGAGVKTSTAETGIAVNGGTAVQSWITGFFPADEPKYAVTVIAEETDPKVAAATPIFREIAEEIWRFESGWQ